MGDIDGVQNDANMSLIAMLVDYVTEIEEKLPLFIQKRLYKARLVETPNTPIPRYILTFPAKKFTKYKMKHIPKMNILQTHDMKLKQTQKFHGDISTLFRSHRQTMTVKYSQIPPQNLMYARP